MTSRHYGFVWIRVQAASPVCLTHTVYSSCSCSIVMYDVCQLYIVSVVAKCRVPSAQIVGVILDFFACHLQLSSASRLMNCGNENRMLLGDADALGLVCDVCVSL